MRLLPRSQSAVSGREACRPWAGRWQSPDHADHRHRIQPLDVLGWPGRQPMGASTWRPGKPAEHGSNRAAIVDVVASHYAPQYQAVFGTLPRSQSMSAPYYRRPPTSITMQMPLAGGGSSDNLTGQETKGLALFIGKGTCLDCHNGPLFTDNDFHNIGVRSLLAAREASPR